MSKHAKDVCERCKKEFANNRFTPVNSRGAAVNLKSGLPLCQDCTWVVMNADAQRLLMTQKGI